jgi:hypothetical protein
VFREEYLDLRRKYNGRMKKREPKLWELIKSRRAKVMKETTILPGKPGGKRTWET